MRYEQAVYGSFPFWDRGYDILTQSPGCRPEWLAGMRSACQKFGERPRGVAEAGGLFALRLPGGPWMILGPSVQGTDDQGRPGALAFHALFLTPAGYRRAGYLPFPFAGALKRDWRLEDQGRSLPAGTWPVEAPGPPAPAAEPLAARIASALARGRRVALESAEPIDSLAEQVWRALPLRTRRRASVASWAFANDNHFDLVALPRLAGVELDTSYQDPAALSGERPAIGDRRPVRSLGSGGPRVPGRWLLSGVLGLLMLAIVAGLGLVWSKKEPGDQTPPRIEAPPPPDRSAYRLGTPGPDERERVAEGLLDLAERFGVITAGGSAQGADPTALMVRLADRLRYHGPLLSAPELARLAASRGPDRDRDRDRDQALDWHEQILRFLPDRPLPGDFGSGPLRWQLDTLTWSFHLDPDPRRSAAEVPHALAHDLAAAGSIRPNPLADRFPILADYARFLDRLPRR